MIQGSSCSEYQTTSRVQRRWALGVLKAVPRPIHGRIGTGDEALGGQSFAAVSAESDVLSVAHTGMPAWIPYLLPQLGTGDAPVAEHDDGPYSREPLGPRLAAVPRWGPSRSLLVGVPDVPGQGMAQPVENADDDGGGLVALRVGSWPRPSRPTATSRGPTAAWREARVTSSSVWRDWLAAVVEPLPAGAGAGCTSCSRARGRRPRRSGRRCRRGWRRRPTAPGRSIVAGRGEVNAFQSFFALPIRWEGASRVSGIWWSQNPSSTWRLLAMSHRKNPIPTPVRWGRVGKNLSHANWGGTILFFLFLY